MKNPVQVIRKALVVSLLLNVFFLEGCSFDVQELLKLPPEQLQVALLKMKEEQVRREEELKEQAAAAQLKAEEQRKKEEELKKKEEQIKQEQREEIERLRLEEGRIQKEKEERRQQQEQLEREKAELQRLLDEQNKNKLNKADLEKEIRRVAPIIEGVANNPDQLEKKIEELTPRGKAINRALKDNKYIGYNLSIDSNNVLTNTDVAILINHPCLVKISEFKLDGLELSKPQLTKLLSCFDKLRLAKYHRRTLHINYEQLAVAKVNNLLRLFQFEGKGFSRLFLSDLVVDNIKIKGDKGTMQTLAQNLDTLAGLEYLNLYNASFLPLMPSLKLLPNLQYLDFSDSSLGDAGMEVLAPCFKGITYLVGLDLGGNNFGTLGAHALAAHLKDLPHLRTLILERNCDIGLEGIQAIAPELRHLSKLHNLGLFNTLFRAGFAGLKALTPYLKDLPRLLELDLGDNKLGDEGVNFLIPSLQSLPRLRFLGLPENSISHVGANSLVQYLNKANISEFRLYLGGNQLGDVGAEAFLSLSSDLNLGRIYLEDNNISDRVANKLQQLSHVEWNINKPFKYDFRGTHSLLNIHVDSFWTSSKEAILGTQF